MKITLNSIVFDMLASKLQNNKCVHHLVEGSRRTFSVKFEIYMHQMTILKGVLDNCSTYFLSPNNYLKF